MPICVSSSRMNRWSNGCPCLGPIPARDYFLWRPLDDWPAWHGGCLALVGPEGAGKTHLAIDWAARVKAAVLRPNCTDVAAAHGRPVLLEDAEKANPETLFHLINMAGAGGGLTSGAVKS